MFASTRKSTPALGFTPKSGSNIAKGRLRVQIWELEPMTRWIWTKVKLEKLAGNVIILMMIIIRYHQHQ